MKDHTKIKKHNEQAPHENLPLNHPEHPFKAPKVEEPKEVPETPAEEVKE